MSTDALSSGPLKTRSFEPVKIKFDRGREVFQTDTWTGEVVARDKATETRIVLSATLEFRGFAQHFEVLGIIRQKEFDTDRLERKVRAALAAGMRERVVSDFYRTAEIVVEPASPELDTYETDATLDAISAVRLEEQAKANDQAMSEWEAAIDEMQEHLSGNVRYKISELRDAFRFVESCTNASRQGFMHMWCEEKLGRIRSALNDLERRKDPNHSGFKASVENIRGPLSSWPMTNGFRTPPPRRQKRSNSI